MKKEVMKVFIDHKMLDSLNKTLIVLIPNV